MPTRVLIQPAKPAPAIPASRRRREDVPRSRSLDSSFQTPLNNSILRELSSRDGEHGDHTETTIVPEQRTADDIKGSPRLIGYMFSMIASGVMLISVFEFNRERKNSALQGIDTEQRGENNDEDDPFVYFLGDAVYKWKLWGALYASALGVLLSFLTVIVHFDTIIAPSFFIRIFRDGSLAERYWIWCLILFWAITLHASTSTLSVGESQANVFFSAWIAFLSIARNYVVWRASAGRPSQVFVRETSYYWFWTAFCSSIFAGAATNMFLNRQLIEIQYRGQTLDLVQQDWQIILCVVWSEVAVCCAAISLNEIPHTNCCRKTERMSLLLCFRYRVYVGWRHVEGLLILVATGAKFWVILRYAAAVGGVIAGLSNAYFGVWGSFLNGVFCLGSWLKENKDIEYVVREEQSEEADEQRS